jgi:hypothetical protein
MTAAQFTERLNRQPNGCLLFPGNPSQRYPQVSYQGRLVTAHRLAYELHFGLVTGGLCVLHKCDTPRCCEPSHLFLGTHRDNMRDAMAKGRMRTAKPKARRPRNKWPIGDAHPMRKLNSDQVRAIRKALAAGLTQTAIAAEYGVNPVCIHHIKVGNSWSHLA